MTYWYIIDFIGVIAAVLGATAKGDASMEGRGGQIHSPKHHSDGVGIEALGGENAVHFEVVAGQVVKGHGDSKAEDQGSAAGPGHVVQTRLSVEVVAATGASADGGLQAASSAMQRVAAGANDQGTRTHKDLRRSMDQG